MRRFISILMLIACTAILPVSPAFAWFFGSDDTLVTIDGTRYTGEDFKRWWKFWNDEGLELPKNPDLYIDWLLLAREGERMELASDPAFQRQTRIFLQSRTLLMLKYDAVDSRIKINDADLWSRYEEQYSPRWLVERLVFDDEQGAAAAWRELSENGVTLQDLLTRDAEAGGPLSRHENWVRPNGIDAGWTAILKKMNVGEVVDPSEHEGGVVLYHLKEREFADQLDFTRFRAQIRRELWKEQENNLTLQLLWDLRKKYDVKIDGERIEALDLNAPDDAFTDDVVISTSRQDVSEWDFIVMARRDMALRPDAAHAVFDEKKAREVKARVVDGIIAQSLTNWEALDRRYEEREPFKWEYDFHVRHRLTTAVEQRLFASEATVSDDEVKRYYEEHLSRFTQPAIVRLYIIDDTQGPVERVWSDVVVRKDFPRAVREHFGRSVQPQEVPLDHLDPDVKSAVEKLAVGETSQPFTAQGSRVLVHLLARTPAEPLPFDRVSGSIRTRLTEQKIDQQRKAYLDLLKSRSKIEVRDRRWQSVKRELGGV